jgi:hypothetical protein
MWDPRSLTTLYASTACYKNSFTFLLDNNNNINNRIVLCKVKSLTCEGIPHALQIQKVHWRVSESAPTMNLKDVECQPKELIIPCYFVTQRPRDTDLSDLPKMYIQVCLPLCTHVSAQIGWQWGPVWAYSLADKPPLCNYSRTFQHFMEPEGSLPSSQEPSTRP